MREYYTPPAGPPRRPLETRLGPELDEAAVRRLLQLHYRNLSETALRDMFPDDMAEAADRSADFFIQIMGGPPYYSERHGPPRMRARHLPFEITPAAQSIWLSCFRQAMDELPFPAALRPGFEIFLEEFSAWMVNAR